MWARQQRQTCLYFSTLTPSNWLSRTRLVPTRILNSCRSFSLFSLSRLWPWCCILTHNLFISAKFRRTKSMESLISPVNSSESLWSKGWTSLMHPNFRKHIKNAGKKNVKRTVVLCLCFTKLYKTHQIPLWDIILNSYKGPQQIYTLIWNFSKNITKSRPFEVNTVQKLQRFTSKLSYSACSPSSGRMLRVHCNK